MMAEERHTSPEEVWQRATAERIEADENLAALRAKRDQTDAEKIAERELADAKEREQSAVADLHRAGVERIKRDGNSRCDVLQQKHAAISAEIVAANRLIAAKLGELAGVVAEHDAAVEGLAQLGVKRDLLGGHADNAFHGSQVCWVMEHGGEGWKAVRGGWGANWRVTIYGLVPPSQ